VAERAAREKSRCYRLQMLLWLLRSAIVMTYPRHAGLPGAEDCALDEHLQRFKRESCLIIWLATLAGGLLFQLTPFMSVYVPLPAFLLPRSLQDKHAMKIQATRFYLLRQAVFLVKLCAGLLWGADPAVRKRLALPVLPPDPGTWRTT
jgi:hypothetical protein